MTRLFLYAGLMVMINLLLALVTGSLFFRFVTIVFGLATVGLYWFLRRGLPPLSGSLTVEGLQEPADVYRDGHGIPHVTARNLHDLYFAQGYVTAQDRIWQMEMSRRTAAGRLAEILGEESLEQDRQMRTIGLYRAAEASLPCYPPSALAILESYAAGVNAFVKHCMLPPEFRLFGFAPQPWTVTDSLAVAKLLAHDLSRNWGDQLFRAELVQAVGSAKAVALFGQVPDQASLDALQEQALPPLDDLLNLNTAAPETVIGSGGWVLAGNRTQSGQPMLGSDLHAAPRIPSAWHQCRLTGPDRLDVAGIGFPGVPGLFSGQTHDFAWNLSTVHAETQDLVVERLDPEHPDHYARPGGWEPASRIVEEIRIRGKKAPVRHEVLITRHGPVLAVDGTTAIALRSSVLTPSTEIDCLLRINHAHTFEEFRAAARGFKAFALAALFAGRDGTIARTLVGGFPVRQKGDGLLPAPGWTGAHEWEGLIVPDSLPEEINPAEGFLVAVGQDLTPPDYPYLLCSPLSPPHQSRRLADHLGSAIGWSRERGERLQTDTVNRQARHLIERLLPSLHEGLRQGPQPEALNELEKRALLLISGWNHDESPGSAGALLWQQWYLFLLEGIFRPQLGLHLFDRFLSTRSASQVADQLLGHVADGRESPWLRLEGEDGLPRIALRSFRRAVALLAAQYGQQPERWFWGRAHRVRFAHPLHDQVRPVARLLDLGPYPAGGSHSTLYRSGYSLLNPFAVGSSTTYRRVVDLGAPEEVAEISAPGVSGHPLSPFGTDQIAVWQKGEYASPSMRHRGVRFPHLVLNPKN